MAYNPTTIANYFITTYASVHAQFTIGKVVSLTYYAYGWYLAFSDCKATLIKEPLICKRVHATFPSLYDNMIDSGVNYYYKKLPNPQGNQTISKEDQLFLDRVWNTYGHLNNLSVKAFYHGDTPWKRTIVKPQTIIPIHEVYEHFKNKLIKAGIKAT